MADHFRSNIPAGRAVSFELVSMLDRTVIFDLAVLPLRSEHSDKSMLRCNHQLICPGYLDADAPAFRNCSRFLDDWAKAQAARFFFQNEMRDRWPSLPFRLHYRPNMISLVRKMQQFPAGNITRDVRSDTSPRAGEISSHFLSRQSASHHNHRSFSATALDEFQFLQLFLMFLVEGDLLG